MTKRLREDVIFRIQTAFSAEAALHIKLPAEEYVKRLEELAAFQTRLEEALLEVEACTTSEPAKPAPVPKFEQHEDQPIEHVLKTLRDSDWKCYGPGFPFQLLRYEGLVTREEFHFDDPTYGPCHSFKIVLTEEGHARAGEASK